MAWAFVLRIGAAKSPGLIKSKHKTDFVVGNFRRLFAIPYSTENFTSCLVKLAAKFFETFALTKSSDRKPHFSLN